MADISSIESLAFLVDDGMYSVGVPSPFRYMKVLWINIRILERLEATGKLDLRYPLPRMWSGYYYCMHENCVIKSGAIEYQNQQIYYKENILYNAEITTIENAWNFQQLDIDEDLLDETSEDALWRNPNDPRFYFLPLQLPIDAIRFSLPAGVSVSVQFCGVRFSPIPYGVGGIYDIYRDDDEDGIPDDLRPLPESPFSFPPPDISDVVTNFEDIASSRGYIRIDNFDNEARSRGYILPSECPVPPIPTTWTISIPTMSWRYAGNNYTLTGASYVRRSRIRGFIIVPNASNQVWIDKRGYGSQSQYSLLAVMLESCSGVYEGLIALTQIETTNPAADRLLSPVSILMNGMPISSGNYSASSMPVVLSQGFICG